MDERDWSRLIFLSVLWGGTFFFTGVALKELPPLTLVFLRLSIAALILLPMLWINRIPFPVGIAGWRPYAVMALINNVMPFSLIVMGQTYIPGGTASVVNATTPVFTVLVAAAFGEEKLILRRVAGVLLGLCGVVILKGYDFDLISRQSIGIALCLGATICFGFSALWATRKLAGSPADRDRNVSIDFGQHHDARSRNSHRSTLATANAGARDVAGGSRPGLSLDRAGLHHFLPDRHSIWRKQRDAGDASCSGQCDPARILHSGREDRGREIVGALVIGSALLVMDGRVFRLFSRSGVGT